MNKNKVITNNLGDSGPDISWMFDPKCLTSFPERRKDEIGTGGDIYYSHRKVANPHLHKKLYGNGETPQERTYWSGGLESFPERRGGKFDNLTTDSRKTDNIETKVNSTQICTTKEPRFAGISGDPVVCSLQPECTHYQSLHQNKDEHIEFVGCSQVAHPTNDLSKAAEKKFYNRK